MQIVLLGAGSEYVLRPLAQAAQRRGLPVLELDMYRPDWREVAQSMIEARFVLVTSHHPYVDAWLYEEAFGRRQDVDCLTSFMATYRPQRTYFIPHDLSELLHPEELCALHLFDALLMPNESSWFLRQYVRVESVGWIKSSSDVTLPATPLTFLLSEIPYYVRHPELFTERFAQVLSRAPRFKTARFDGGEIVERLARAAGCEIISPEVDSTSLLASTDVVVSNGISSVVTESVAMGIETLCVMDAVHPEQVQLKQLGNFDNLTLLPPDQCGDWIDSALTRRPSRDGSKVRPFDFDKAFQVILGD